MRAMLPVTRQKLLSASGLALATALVASAPALRAQSFQATPTSTFGSVTINTTPTTTAITVSSPSAVINWTPTDTAATGGPIIFQTSGTTATFTNNPAANSDFAVLNRIIPSGSTRPIQFDGTVVSRLQTAAGGQVPGGTVFFYSPGGILIGASSVFDVGNLVLTTSDLNFDSAGNFDSSGSYVFQPATVAGSQIIVNAGAQLGATVDGSYIAMVAPSVTNNGTITVNGSAALVAADAATITFSPSGLFDIQVDSGTSATGTVAANNGTITGPVASGGTFLHRIYMVAVPKNDAITMAINAGSTLGFDIAGAADVSGNTIILSAGHNVNGGNPAFAPSAGGGTGLVSITGGDADITSNFVASATGGVVLGSTSSAGLDFASNVSIEGAGGSNSIFSNTGGRVNVAGDLSISGNAFGANTSPDVTAHSAEIYATDGGAITIGGNVLITANAFGGAAVAPGATGGQATGSFAKIQSNNGGQITISGNATLQANALGGQAQTTGAGGGGATAGTAWVLSTGTGGSSVQIAGTVDLSAAATGANGLGCVTCTLDGGSAQGGLTAIRANGDSTISIGAAAQLTASALAGSSATGAGGNAAGGQVSIFTLDTSSLSLHSTTGSANAVGGDGATAGGSALGGNVSLSTNATSGTGITINGQARFDALAFASNGIGASGASGSANGGSVNIFANTTDISITGSLDVSAGAFGATGAGSTLAVTGGFVTAEARNGATLSATTGISLTANANGTPAGGTTAAGAATGGTVDIFANGGTVQAAGLFMTANGSGGAQFGSAASGAGNGGLAHVRVSAGGQLLASGDIDVAATGRGGDGTDGSGAAGNGNGGIARITMTGGQLSGNAALSLVAEGYGGNGTVAGSGQGGSVNIAISDAAFTSNGIAYIGAIGSGGDQTSFTPGSSAGSATGGSILFTSNRSTVHLSQTGDATFEVTGFAGSGETPASGTGGGIQFSANSSTVDAFNSLNLFAEGVGSLGIAGGNGGDGVGGDVSLLAGSAVSAVTQISAPTLQISATGRGGDGAIALTLGQVSGSGGNAQGGDITLLSAPDGGVFSSGQLLASAAAVAGSGADGISGTPTGGQGGVGGTATGGRINIGSATPAGGTGAGGYQFDFASMSVLAQGGNGGNGGSGPTQGAGGSGGAATGGSATVFLDLAGSTFSATGDVNFLADANGGNGGTCGITCTAAGGNAQGGALNLGTGLGSTGRDITIGGTLTMSALGFGGGSYGVTGGSATGGTVLVRLDSGMSFSASQVELYASARGGDEFTNQTGGSAQGGSASFIASGTSTATVSGTINIYSDGNGGSGRDIGASGGAGTGGTSRLYSGGGAITVTGGTAIEASGFGGAGSFDSTSGSGGAGTGGTALLTVGTPTALGNNGNINVGGFTFVTSEGTGGDGWQGGIGTGGFVGISARQGTLTLDTVFATGDGFGGYGLLGGSGGSATGGTLEVFANNALEGASQVTITSLTADASASGGFGGNSGVPGGTGGVGGAAEGGSVIVAGSAGNGRMQVGSVNALANGTGGGGGLGGIGGAGGNGTGGAVQIGTVSGLDTGSLNTGSGTYANVLAFAAGIGGDGGSGDASTGTGGAGGNALAGGTTLLVRGSQTTITGTGSFAAHAVGGNGGAGATLGAGGNASVGNVTSVDQLAGAALVITSRFQQPTQRGSLTAGDLSFSATATGGTGSVAGTSTMIGDAVDVQLINGDFTGTNLSLQATADAVTPGSLAEFIAMTGSSANLTGGLLFTTPGAFSLTLDQSALNADHVSISAGNWVFAASAPATVGTLSGASSLSLSSGQDLVGYANLSTQGSLTLLAGGRIDFGALFALGAIDVTAGNSLTLGDVNSGDSIDLTSQAVAATGNLTAATSISVTSASNVTTGNLAAGSGTPSGANGDLYSIGIRSGGNVVTGAVFAASDLGIAAAGNLTTGFVRAFDNLLLAGGSVSVDSLSIVNRTLIANSSMAVLGQTPAGFDKELVFAAVPVATAGAVAIANQSTFGTLRIAAGTTVTAGNLFAGGSIGVTSTGNMNFGNVQAQSNRLELISRSGSITANNLFSQSDVLASGAAGLSLAQVRGRDLALLSNGNVSVQLALAGIVTNATTNQITNATGRLLIANSSMLPVTSALPGSINYNALFAATPVRTGGTATISQAAVAGRISAATAGNFTGGGMAGFSGIEVESGGLVTVSQRWGGPQVTIVSADIAIIDNGPNTTGPTGPTGPQILSGIRTTETGFVDLISNSSSTALIGDGLTGSGYSLSNSEIGLISTGELTIAAVDQSANATDMLIGNVSLTAGGTIGSSIAAGSAGKIIFATGNLQTQTPGGAIRVVGTVNGTGFAQSNILEFTTGRFELDAATGAINLTSASQQTTGAPLGGVIEINAANIHVAAGSILEKLAADPLYAGRIEELNAPAAVQRPEGVLRALGLDLLPTGTLYIQNTGTALNPAGFLANFDLVDVTAPTNATPGTISIVVNGAFQTPTGIVSGFAAHDLVVNDPDANFAPYTVDSQINGCLLSATVCSVMPEGPDTIGQISGQIEIISNQTLGSTPTFVEEPAAPASEEGSDDEAPPPQQEEASEGEQAASSPIAPPPQLIDSRPLEPQTQVEQPVAGSGNPALIGSVVNENSAEGDDQ